MMVSIHDDIMSGAMFQAMKFTYGMQFKGFLPIVEVWNKKHHQVVMIRHKNGDLFKYPMGMLKYYYNTDEMSKKNDTEKSILPKFDLNFKWTTPVTVTMTETETAKRNNDIMDALSYSADVVRKYDPVLQTHRGIMANNKHEEQHEALTDMLDGQLTDKMNAAIQIAVHTYMGDKLKEIGYFMDKQTNENMNLAKRITNTREMQEKLYQKMTQQIHNALSYAYANKEKIKVIEKAIQDCVYNDRAFADDLGDFNNKINKWMDIQNERHGALDSKVDIHKESSDKHLVALQTQLSNVKREIANIQDKDDPVQWI